MSLLKDAGMQPLRALIESLHADATLHDAQPITHRSPQEVRQEWAAEAEPFVKPEGIAEVVHQEAAAAAQPSQRHWSCCARCTTCKRQAAVDTRYPRACMSRLEKGPSPSCALCCVKDAAPGS